MLSFRQKILLSYTIIFLVVVALLIPYAHSSVTATVRNILDERTSLVIDMIKTAPDLDAMIARLEEQKSQIFFRVTLLNQEGKILYDSHKPLESEASIPHPYEVKLALQGQTGYHEDYSYHFSQHFAYVAKAFKYHGEIYILRTAF